MNELQKAAEILVESGYGINAREPTDDIDYIHITVGFIIVIVDLFADTLEGRRQADAIEDYLMLKKGSLIWAASQNATANMCQDKDLNSNHKWRLDRIKWCLNELSK